MTLLWHEYLIPMLLLPLISCLYSSCSRSIMSFVAQRTKSPGTRENQSAGSLAFLVSLLFLLHTPFGFPFHGAFNTAFHAMEQEYENGIFYIGFCLYTVVDRKFI